jgi:hypothetical protein
MMVIMVRRLIKTITLKPFPPGKEEYKMKDKRKGAVR